MLSRYRVEFQKVFFYRIFSYATYLGKRPYLYLLINSIYTVDDARR